MAEDVTGQGGVPPRERGWEGPYPAGPATVEVLQPGAFRRVSWGAIFAGTIVALVVELVLGTLGLAVMLGSINPASSARPFEGLGGGSAVWYVFTALVALFAGGWTAGRMCGTIGKVEGAMHGIVSWGVVTLFSTWIMTAMVGAVLSGAFGIVGATLGAVGQGIGAVAPTVAGAVGQQLQEQGVTPNTIGNQIQQFLRETGNPALQPEALQRRVERAQGTVQQAAGQVVTQPNNALDVIENALGKLAVSGGAVVNSIDRQDAINVIVARTDLNQQQAAQVVDQWIIRWNTLKSNVSNAAQQAGQTAAQVTEDVSGALGQFMFLSFVGMVLGLLAAGFGGYTGVPLRRARAIPVTAGVAEH